MKAHPIKQLYFQFLKPKGLPIEKLNELVTKLYESEFIDLFYKKENPDVEYYVELYKLTSGEFKDELFKIIGGLK